MTTAAPSDGVVGDGAFDYIIVGGGTAGLVVASRVSEDSDVRVLVIEAGADHSNNPLVLTPGLAGGMYGNEEFDLNFGSVPQPALNNRVIRQVKGRLLGGNSALNLMMVLYPSRAIINAWAALGNTGWAFDELVPYYRKFGTTYGPPTSTHDASRMDGYYDSQVSDKEAGPLDISFTEGENPAHSAWMDTFKNLGLCMSSDPRSGAAIGSFQCPATINPATKTRTSAVSAYYTDDVRRRSNLIVFTETRVTRVLLEKTGNGETSVATGVVIRSKDGQEKTVLSRCEVVVAAGALQTPQILELSGIGGRQLLEQHDIPVSIDNPAVGERMQDHPVVCQSFEVAPNIPSLDTLRDPGLINAAMAQYQATREGPLGESVGSCAYVPMMNALGPLSPEARKELFDKLLQTDKDTDQRLPAQNKEREVMRQLLEVPNEACLQYALFPGQVHIPSNPKSFADHLMPVAPENYLTIMTVLSHPFSRGSCHIVSAKIDDKPIWDPRFNSAAIDVEILARGVLFAETLTKTAPLSEIIKPGGKRIPDIKADDLEAAKEVIKVHQMATSHACGTCAMLPRELGGVVDNRLRVYGVRNLRIVDASIFPLEPLGNPQTTVYAVAERAADIIKEDTRAEGAAI